MLEWSWAEMGRDLGGHTIYFDYVDTFLDNNFFTQLSPRLLSSRRYSAARISIRRL
jgi:hypothetical protein